MPSYEHAPDRGRDFPICGDGDEPSELILFKYALRKQLPLPNRQSVIPPQDMLRGPVHLHHSAVAIGDNHSRSELIERSQRSGRFPRQVAKLGMQSGRVAQGLKQLLKPRATNRTERRLVDPLMNAKNDGVGRVIEEPRPDNVTNTGLDYKVIIPLVAAEGDVPIDVEIGGQALLTLSQ